MKLHNYLAIYLQKRKQLDLKQSITNIFGACRGRMWSLLLFLAVLYSWPLVLTSRMAANLPEITWNFYANDGNVILERSADKHQCLRNATCIRTFMCKTDFPTAAGILGSLVWDLWYGFFSRTLTKTRSIRFLWKIRCKERRSLGAKKKSRGHWEPYSNARCFSS